MTLLGCNHLAYVIIVGFQRHAIQNRSLYCDTFGLQSFGIRKNLCVTVQFLLCFVVNLRAIFKYKPPGLIFGGAIERKVFALRVWRGGYMWRGLYMGGLIFSGFYGNLQKLA